MKIAIFTDVLLEVPGGIGSSITAMKKGLEARGHQVLVFAPGWHVEKDPSIVVVPTMRHFKPNGAPWGRRPSVITKWILANHPEIKDFDLIHTHYEGPTSISAIEIAKKCHIPLVQTLHGREDRALRCNTPLGTQNLISGLLGALQRKSFRRIGLKTVKITQNDPKLTQKSPNQPKNGPITPLLETTGARRMWQIMLSQASAADLLILPAEHFRQKLSSLGSLPETAIFPNSIDDDIVPIDPQPRTWDGKSPLEITWNSRLSREKRFLPLLTALKIAGTEGLNYHLTAYGDGNDLKKAQKYVKKHHLNVTFKGRASRQVILRSITKSHLSAITSANFDVHSLTLVEAEACGTPLLICDPDMVASLPKNSFILSEDPSPAAIAAALLDLQTHPENIAKMSEIMLKHRTEIYQSTRIRELEKIYSQIRQNML